MIWSPFPSNLLTATRSCFRYTGMDYVYQISMLQVHSLLQGRGWSVLAPSLDNREIRCIHFIETKEARSVRLPVFLHGRILCLLPPGMKDHFRWVFFKVKQFHWFTYFREPIYLVKQIPSWASWTKTFRSFPAFWTSCKIFSRDAQHYFLAYEGNAYTYHTSCNKAQRSKQVLPIW